MAAIDGLAKKVVTHYLHPKKRKALELEAQAAQDEIDDVTTVMIQFTSKEGDVSGPQLQVPMNATTEQLGELINNMLENDDTRPYSFFFNDEEIAVSLKATLRQQSASTEVVLPIVYHEQALFRVRAVTRCSATIPGHTEAVLHVNFSPNGRQLVSGSGDTTVRLWDVDTGTPNATLRGHQNWVLAVAWSPNGEYIASGGMDKEVRIWKESMADSDDDGDDDDAADTNDASSPSSTASSSSSSAAAASAATAATKKPAARKKIKVTKNTAKNGRKMGRNRLKCKPLKGHKKWITHVVWEPLIVNPACQRVATASKDGTIKVWDIVHGRCLMTLSGHTNAVKCVKWGGSGLLYSASQDRTIKVWDTAQGKLVRTLEGHAHWVNTLSLNTDYALRTGPYNHRGVAPTDADEIATTCRTKYDAVTAVSGGRELLVSGSDDYTLHLWSPATDKKPIVRMTGHQQPVNFVCYSPDGRYIASASFDNSVRLWDGVTGKFMATFRGHVQSVYQVCWSADSRLLCSASQDSTMKIWDIKMKKMRKDLPGHADEVYAVDWSPDGVMICSGGKDKVLKLWRF